MSDAQPHGPRHGNGGKYIALLLLGLVIGAICTVMALRALDARKDHFHESVMHVQAWHLRQLATSVEQNRCSANESLPHLQTLRTMANDLEPAFPDLRDDARFVEHASQMRAALDAALSQPPLNCAGLDATTKKIGETCKACHQDFRS